MNDKAISLLLAAFPIAWGTAMIFYARKRPEKIRMSYGQFRIMCLFIIAGGVLLTFFIAFFVR